MGIPSYFSYIIRKYPNIIRKECGQVQLLMMDCNSIIYDAYHDLQEEYKKSPFDLSLLEDRIIKMTIRRICDYILLIKPDKLAYVTFDGVAPMAKMDQQRERRYKSAFFGSNNDIWNTANITPGTPFMKKLSAEVTQYFSVKHSHLLNINIRTSCSDEPGEGEHKLFQYIRDNDCTEDVVAVYGLDADLIILSILHIHKTKEIYVFREAPNFKSVISVEEEIIKMVIKELYEGIYKEMVCCREESDKENRVKDYIFLTFFLGNDFLPHMASLNIRRNGMEILMETYKKEIGKELIVKSGEIEWKNVERLIKRMAEREEKEMKRETNERGKKRLKRSSNEELWLNMPMIYRMDEIYINAGEEGWEERYYRRVHGKEKKENISKKYIEGLEWCQKYYSEGCINWEWRYGYSGAPLLRDIKCEKVCIRDGSKSRSESEQLEYVMPKGEEREMSWEYKRYNWESKVK